MYSTYRSTVSTAAAAALVAGAVAAGPALHNTVAATSFAPVALTAFDGPIGELALTVGLISNDLFNGSDLFDDYAWEPYQGLLPEFIFTALPIISQLGFNGSFYLGTAVDALTTAVFYLDNAAVNLPSALITAAGQAISGNIPAALNTLYNATVVPVQDAVFTLFGAGSTIVSSVVTNLINVIGTLPTVGVGLVNTVIGGAGALVGAVVNIVTQTFAAVAGGDLQTAWNTVIDGLFGPVGEDGSFESSIPGVIESMTIGPGLGPLGYPDGYQIPSLRMWGEQSQLEIANALGASYPVPLPGAANPAAARKAAHTASPAAAVAADGGDTATAAADTGESRSAGASEKRSEARKVGARGR